MAHVNTAVNTIINAQVPIAMRDNANAVLRQQGMTLSAYIRHCLERLIAAQAIPFKVDDFTPLAKHLLAEIEAGGPAAEALIKRLGEVAEPA